MIKIQSNEETDKLVANLVDNYLLRHTIQFFYKADSGLPPTLAQVCSAGHCNGYLCL